VGSYRPGDVDVVVDPCLHFGQKERGCGRLSKRARKKRFKDAKRNKRLRNDSKTVDT